MEVTEQDIKQSTRELANELDIGVPKKVTLEGVRDETELRELVIKLLLHKDQHNASEVLVDNFLDMNNVHTTRFDEKNECWIYNEGIYVPQGRTFIREYVRKIIGEGYSTYFCNQIISKIEVDTYIDQDKFFEEEDMDLICVNNGIIKVRTNEFISHNPKYKFFSKLPINYDETKDCKKIKKFFKEILKNPNEDIDVIQELFGYLLHREYTFEKAFMFLGSGRNGKGKTLSLMKKFIGIDNCIEVPLDHLETDQFAIGELFKKSANLCGDLSKTAITNSGNFKKITGRDLLSAPRKFLSRVSFENYSKQIFSCNELPLTNDVTEAFFNRWIMIEFPFTFLPQEEINKLENTKNVKLRNPNIIEEISSDEELSGLLNWSLEGLKRLFKKKSFSNSPTTLETRNMWFRKSDSCLSFCIDNIEEDYDSYMLKDNFKNMYKEYCKKHRLKVSIDKSIKNILESHFGVSQERKYFDVGVSIHNQQSYSEQKYVWKGIKLKNIHGGNKLSKSNK